MSNITDKEVDKLFKRAAEGFHEPYNEAMWSDMDARLSTVGGGELSFYKTVGAILGGIAVVVGIILLLQGILPKGGSIDQHGQAVLNHNQLESLPSAASASNEKVAEIGVAKIDSESKQRTAPSGGSIGVNGMKRESTTPLTYQADNLAGHAINRASSHRYQNDQNPGLLEGLKIATDYPYFELNRHLPLVDTGPIVDEKKEGLRPSFAVKAAYATDLSSIGYFSPDSPGSTFGVLGEFSISSKWFVSVGALLAHKKYYSNDAEATTGYGYHTDRLDAKCKVIDIPINAGYYFFKNERQGFYATTGLSSYLMLSEDYVFESTDYMGNNETWSQHYENESNHFFGVVNFSIGYEHRLRHNMYIQLEPYLKMPTTGIGEGKVDLVSSGAFINIKYHFGK